jgi:hypothetical protein
MVDKPVMIIATEVDMTDGCKHLRYIRFPLDDGKTPICYRSRVSYNAFAYSVKGRNYNPNFKNARILWACDHEDQKTWMDSDIPIIDVKNVWEFYKLIGYDYKTKKYESS